MLLKFDEAAVLPFSAWPSSETSASPVIGFF
jgi:hypothetical protein